MPIQFTPPADSLKNDQARFMAHVVVIGAAVTLFCVLVAAVTMMSVMYWG